MITVVGLGADAKQITLGAVAAIKASCHIFLKTTLTPTFDYFKDGAIPFVSLDFLYENAEDFDKLNDDICNYLIEQDNKLGDICYCVNGSGSDDRSVLALSQKCPVQIVYGVSNGTALCPPSLATISISAYELLSMRGFDYDTRCGLKITDIDNEAIASDIKLALGNLVGEEEKVLFCGREIFVYEIDRQKKYNYATTIFCPPLNLIEKKRFNFVDLYNILQVLRAPDGCPWDKAQTHQSIRQNTIEEAYELATAIDNNDLDNLIEESGDVILQSMFHCVIGEDCGEFNLQDTMTMLCQKLISRHTHIFGNVIANNADEARKAWDNAKAKEKSYDTATSKMKGVAESLPALMKAKKMQSIAKKNNMDFDNLDGVVAKIYEKLKEVATAKPEELEMECGDLLFSVVNLLRWKDVSPEVALNRSVNKFVTRFEYIEKHCDKPMQDMSSDQLNNLWEEAKKLENF